MKSIYIFLLFLIFSVESFSAEFTIVCHPESRTKLYGAKIPPIDTMDDFVVYINDSKNASIKSNNNTYNSEGITKEEQDPYTMSLEDRYYVTYKIYKLNSEEINYGTSKVGKNSGIDSGFGEYVLINRISGHFKKGALSHTGGQYQAEGRCEKKSQQF